MSAQQQSEVKLYLVVTGWHASAGNGWAESGATSEEALANYRKAEQRRREILHDDQGGQDPELAALAAQLQETAQYAISPTFKERLRELLVEGFRHEFSATH